MTIDSQNFFNQWWPRLLPLYDEREARALTRWLMEDFFGLTQVDILSRRTVTIGDPSRWQEAFIRLQSGHPVQHILGYAWFRDRKYHVSPDVLIPRPETEELVQTIIDDHPGFDGRILDIGTGSGIIPVSLALELPEASLYGLDCSPDALAVAKKNAAAHQTDIRWIEMDILTDCPRGTFDLIVSNPPYIPTADRRDMHPNVLGKDPDLALFVPDDDPLLFYHRIVHLSDLVLTPGGSIYFEIHEKMGEATRSLLAERGYQDIQVIRDIHGKDRIVTAHQT